MLKILDFYADWCQPCKQLSPILEQIEEELDWVTIEKINVEDDVDNYTEQFSIRNIPTLLIFKDERLVSEIIGYTPKEKIINKLQQFK